VSLERTSQNYILRPRQTGCMAGNFLVSTIGFYCTTATAVLITGRQLRYTPSARLLLGIHLRLSLGMHLRLSLGMHLRLSLGIHLRLSLGMHLQLSLGSHLRLSLGIHPRLPLGIHLRWTALLRCCTCWTGAVVTVAVTTAVLRETRLPYTLFSQCTPLTEY
jgi:hypothetical protein